MRLKKKEITDAVKAKLAEALFDTQKVEYVGYYNGEFKQLVEDCGVYDFPAVYIKFFDTKNESSANHSRTKKMSFGVVVIIKNYDGVDETLFGQEGALEISDLIEETLDDKDLGLNDKGLNKILQTNDYTLEFDSDEISGIGLEFEVQYYYEID